MLRTCFAVLSVVSLALACVPTQVITTTTTAPCCQPLTINNLPKIPPVGVTNYAQCSVLRRISSICPTSGYLVCSAAPDTNPTSVLVQVLDSTSAVVNSGTGGRQATVRIFCVNGLWKSSSSGAGATITQVTCSQTGSAGADFGNVDAIDERVVNGK